MQDESFLDHDPMTERRHWIPEGGRIVPPHNGRHRKAVAHGHFHGRPEAL